MRNLNKKSITIDGKLPEGKELLWKLIEKADVFFENYGPGAWDRMGFSYEEVKKHNPNIIYVTLKGFARDSQWGDCVTYDPVASSMGGSAYICGYEDKDPMLCGINIADSGSGIHAGLTILLAILHKKLTGKGQFIETPMRDTVVCMCRDRFAELAMTGHVRRAGNAYHGMKPCAPHNVYPTKPSEDTLGDYIAIACSADDESEDFANLCRAMGREELINDARFLTPALRYENREVLDAEIRKWTVTLNKFEAMEILMKQYNVPAGAVESMDELLKEEFLHSTIYKNVYDTVCGGMDLPMVPIRMSDSPIEPVSPGPTDTHNEEVFKGTLGMSDEEYEQLRAKKVI